MKTTALIALFLMSEAKAADDTDGTCVKPKNCYKYKDDKCTEAGGDWTEAEQAKIDADEKEFDENWGKWYFNFGTCNELEEGG